MLTPMISLHNGSRSEYKDGVDSGGEIVELKTDRLLPNTPGVEYSQHSRGGRQLLKKPEKSKKKKKKIQTTAFFLKPEKQEYKEMM